MLELFEELRCEIGDEMYKRPMMTFDRTLMPTIVVIYKV